MKSMSSSGVRNALWEGGEITVCPTGTPRVRAISGLTFAAGSTPPSPGFAPWESLMEMHLTCGRAALAANSPGSKRPSASRQPK